MLRYDELHISEKCNNNCRCCAYRSASPDIPYGKKIDSFEHKENIKILGGEPTLSKELPSIIAYAKKAGYKRIMVHTNGAMFYYRDLCQKMIDAGAYLFEIKVFAHEPRLHRKICNADTFDYSIAGIRNLKDIKTVNGNSFNAFINILVPVCKENLPCLQDIVAMVAPMRIDRITFRLADMDMPILEAAASVRSAIRSAISRSIWANTIGFPLCVMKGDEYHVSELYAPSDERLSRHAGCRDCVFSDACDGALEEYTKIHGSGDFVPVKESSLARDILDFKNETV